MINQYEESVLYVYNCTVLLSWWFLCPSLPLFFSTLLNCRVFSKLKNPTSDKWWGRFDFGDSGCVWFVKYWILHLQEQKELCYQLWYFLIMNKRGLTLNCGIFLRERALLCCSVQHLRLKKKQFKSTPTWSPGCVSLTKTVTESIPVCSAVGGSYGSTRHLSSFLIHPPFQLFVVLWWCISCVLLRCSPHHHHHHHHRHITGRGGGTLVPKKGIKPNPSATFDVLNRALMLPPTLKQKCILLSVY